MHIPHIPLEARRQCQRSLNLQKKKTDYANSSGYIDSLLCEEFNLTIKPPSP